jgi:hypothetical protein
MKAFAILSAGLLAACAPVATTTSQPTRNSAALSAGRPALDTFQNVGFSVLYSAPELFRASFVFLGGTVRDSSGYQSRLRLAPDYDAESRILVPHYYPTRNRYGVGVFPASGTYDVSVRCRIAGHAYTLTETFRPRTSWQVITPADAIPNYHWSRSMNQ